METAYFAAGCFWGVEHKFMNQVGVSATEVGYMNGQTDNPTYKEVCSDTTGHVEAVKVVFDPDKVTFRALCDFFWTIHDPTTLNRQGPDSGTQYRSGIYFENESQRESAEASKESAQSDFSDPIVTEVVPADRFYPAEEYHQKYFVKNGGSCSI